MTLYAVLRRLQLLLVRLDRDLPELPNPLPATETTPLPRIMTKSY